MDLVTQGTEAASQGFSKAQASLVTLASVTSLAKDAFNLFKEAGTAAIAAISEGSAIDDVNDSFGRLTKQAGVAGDVLLNDFSKALDDTISKTDLMRQANELLRGGLDPKQFDDMAAAARVFAEETGTNAKDAMEALSNQLLKGNTRFTDSIGLIIDNNKVLQEYADKHGVAAEALSELAKKEAIRDATLEIIKKHTQEYGDVARDAGDRIERINSTLSESYDKILQKIAGDAGLNAALDSLNETLKGIDYTAVANGIIEIANAFIQVINLAAKAAAALSAFANGTSALDRGVGKLVVSSGPLDKFDLKLESIVDLLGKGTKEATEKALVEFKNLNAELAQSQAKGESVQEAYVYLNAEVSKVAPQVMEAAKGFGLLKESHEVIIPPIKKVTGGLIDSVYAAKQAQEGHKKLAEEGLKKAKEEADALNSELEKLANNDWAQKLLSDIEAAKQGGGLFGDLFDNLFGDGTANQAPEAIKKGRDLGYNISLALSQGLADGLENGFTIKTGTDFLAGAGKAFADEVGLSFLNPLIDVAGGFLEKGLEHIFGGESAGLTARKAADRFFADAFDANRLAVVIDDQLKVIDDLVFKGDTLFGGNVDFTNSSFSNFLASLPGEAQAAFNGVGAAFEELLGIGEDVGGQLAAVFANNVGGSLNNLQLLVASTGKSFEELEGAVVTAFEDGRLSALEAQTALNGLAQVAQKGIPDGIGFTVQAFKNLEAAGTKGGRTAVDALQDIAFEAKEIGIKDFPALAANLAASGQFTADEIQKLFDSLKANGITSIDQLTKATTQQLIPVLANLQANSFPFKEAADSAATFVEQINSLPDSKTITLNVRTNIDDAGQQVLNTVSGSGATFNNGNRGQGVGAQ